MKKYIYITAFILIFPFILRSQNSSENYIKSTTYLIETQDGNVGNDSRIETIAYYDDLGRPLQQINVRAGGNREDLIVPIRYDNFGRQVKSYLPFPLAQNNGAIYDGSSLSFETEIANYYKAKFPKDFYQGNGLSPDWDNPFSESILEDSPKSRVLEEGAPGFDWKVDYGNEHTISYEYKLGGAGIYYFTVDFSNDDHTQPTLSYNGSYTTGELFVTKIQDENGADTDGIYGKSYEYRNAQGNLVLKRTTVDAANKTDQDPNYHDTYYIYDDYDNLAYVLSPEASNLIVSSGSLVLNHQQLIDDLGYQYIYDNRDRLIEKKIPGKDWEYAVYNKLDQLVFTQDGFLRQTNSWAFMKYDRLGRIVYTGTSLSGQDREGLQTYVNNSNTLYEETTSTPTTINGVNLYYTNNAMPNGNGSGYHIQIINYYDEYLDHTGVAIPNNVFGVNPHNSNTKGLPTVRRVRVLDTNDWIVTIMGYDRKGQLVFSDYLNNFLNASDDVSRELDFMGKELQTKTGHYKSGMDDLTVYDYYTYDQLARIKTYEQKINDAPAQLITENHYDDLGQFVKKNVGGVTLIDGYSNLAGVEANHNGTVYKANSLSSWNAGLITRGELAENAHGGVSAKVSTLGKAMRVGLLNTGSTSTTYEYLNYGIYLTGNLVSLGENELKYIVNGAEYPTSATYQSGDEVKIEVTNNGTTIAFSVNGNIFHTINNVTAEKKIGKAVFRDQFGKITEFKVFDTSTTDPLQEVDYAYNVRGWLTDINDIEATNPTGIVDLFDFRINYNRIEGNTVGKPLFNGNISQTFWRSANSDNDLRSYNYVYDDLNRIKEATSYKGTDINTMVNTNNHNLENVSYDRNGNILTLSRYGYNDNGTVQGLWDNLTYQYSGNKLLNVMDNANTSLKDFGFKDSTSGFPVDYEYDSYGNGNMVKDRNKGIDNIVYNQLNLPVHVDIDNGVENGTITYVYDATGVKQSKTLTQSGIGSVTTQYVGSFIYNDNATQGTQTLQFIGQSEGYVKPIIQANNSPGGGLKGPQLPAFSYIDFDYVFQYKDHLGNVRLSYSDTNDNGIIETSNELIEESNYYPFGLKQNGYNFNISSNGNTLAQQWKYNGTELNEDISINLYEMDMRQYDPAIARWTALDPVIHFNYSPYQAFDNNPVFWSDPSGANAVYNWKGPNKGKYTIGKDVVSFEEAMASHGLGITGEKRDPNKPLIGGMYNGKSFNSIEAKSISAYGWSNIVTKKEISNSEFEAYIDGVISELIAIGRFYGVIATLAGGSIIDAQPPSIDQLKEISKDLKKNKKKYKKEFKKLFKKGKIPKTIKSINPISIMLANLAGYRAWQVFDLADQLIDLRLDYYKLNGDKGGEGIYVIYDKTYVGTMGGQGWSDYANYYDVRTNKVLKSTHIRF